MTKTFPTREIDLKLLQFNTGQIPGLPRNPRVIKDRKFNLLVNSLIDTPEMIHLRELIVVAVSDYFVVIAGNMRLKALQHIKAGKAPCKVLPADFDVEKLKEIAIKDNNPFGEWDFELIANEWDVDQLTNWGLDIPNFNEPEMISFQAKPKGYEVTVECSDESDRQAVIELLSEKGYKAS